MATKHSTRLSAERLREVLDYDPETGIFRWCVALSFRVRVGDEAGAVWRDPKSCLRYRFIRIDGKLYRAQRLAWLYVKGEWPKHGVDHRDKDGLNNRWRNLREATQYQNAGNSRVRRSSRSGVKGVRRHKSGRYGARIMVNRKEIGLGTFATLDEAQSAYMDAARRYFGEFASPG